MVEPFYETILSYPCIDVNKLDEEFLLETPVKKKLAKDIGFPVAKKFSIFIIANPKSGGQGATKFLQKGQQLPYETTVISGIPATVHGAFDLRTDLPEAALAIEKHLKNKIDISEHTLIAILSGDGSLGATLDSLFENTTIKSNLDKLIFAPMPFGTGNDMGRTLGWGKKEGSYGASMENLVDALTSQNYDKFSVWDIEVHCNELQEPNGNIMQETPLKKKMMCYFNLGVDANIAFDGESAGRTGSRASTTARYTWASVKQFLCRCNFPGVSNYVQNITQIKQGEEETLLTNVSLRQHGDPFCIVGTNIASNNGGMNMQNWSRTANNVGVAPTSHEGYSAQSYKDSKLEVIGCISKINMALMKYHRYAQPDGSWELRFDTSASRPNIPVYFTIDGEPYILHDPVKVKFSLFNDMPGSINILRGPLPHLQYE